MNMNAIPASVPKFFGSSPPVCGSAVATGGEVG